MKTLAELVKENQKLRLANKKLRERIAEVELQIESQSGERYP